MDKTHRCRYCQKLFSKTDRAVEKRETRFGETLYHTCRKSPFPNKFVALDTISNQKIARFFGAG